MKRDNRNEGFLNFAFICFLIFILIFSFYNIYVVAPKNSEKETFEENIETEDVEKGDVETTVTNTTPTEKVQEILISSCIVKHESSEDRDYNMSLACSKIDGLVLQPNQEFNWFEIVGEASKENGYKKAPVIINKKSAMWYGGGICQVATAVYNLIYQVDIVPTELHHHSLQSSYAAKGMDATVAWSNKEKNRKNFVFINTKDYPIKIKIHEENGNVVAELYQISE